MGRDLEKKREYQKEYYLKNKETLKKYRTDWYFNNRELGIERAKKWAENNKDARKNNYLKSAHNITLDDYNKMFQEQEGRCKCCYKHQSELSKPLFVDHCHTTGKIRGLLCNKCNLALGYVNDNITVLKNLIKYLEDASLPCSYQN